jgi:hypothetical protein
VSAISERVPVATRAGLAMLNMAKQAPADLALKPTEQCPCLKETIETSWAVSRVSKRRAADPTEQDRDGDLTLLFVIIKFEPTRNLRMRSRAMPRVLFGAFGQDLRSRVRPCGPDQGSRNQGV